MVTNVTYDGVSDTEIRMTQHAAADLGSYLGYIVNSSTGSNTIEVTAVGNNSRAFGGAVSLTGVDTSSPLDADTGAIFTNDGSPSTNITTVADNAWIIDAILTNISNVSGDGTPDTGTQRVEINGSSHQFDMSTRGPISPAAETAVGWSNYSASSESTLTVASFKPTAGAATVVKDPIGPGIIPFAR